MSKATTDTPANLSHRDDGDAVAFDRSPKNSAGGGTDADALSKHFDDVFATTAGGLFCFAQYATEIVAHRRASSAGFGRRVAT
jgi:hypothetical protein